jgi:hypothetical protein
MCNPLEEKLRLLKEALIRESNPIIRRKIREEISKILKILKR